VRVGAAVCARLVAEARAASCGCKVGVMLGVNVCEGVGVRLGVNVAVAVKVGVDVGVTLGVLVAVSVNVGVAVAVAVNVGVGVAVLVAVAVKVCEGVSVALGVDVGATENGCRSKPTRNSAKAAKMIKVGSVFLMTVLTLTVIVLRL